MFILETNILSATMQRAPVPEVAEWMAGQGEDDLFTTSVSHAEIFAGLAIMADGRRRRALEETARAMFEEFEGRVLPFDTDASAAYADLFALRRSAGRPAATLDLMIASIARSHSATMVTRDSAGFEGCGLTLINPWAAA
jgi:predicted nucleic acid-binding protein